MPLSVAMTASHSVAIDVNDSDDDDQLDPTPPNCIFYMNETQLDSSQERLKEADKARIRKEKKAQKAAEKKHHKPETPMQRWAAEQGMSAAFLIEDSPPGLKSYLSMEPATAMKEDTVMQVTPPRICDTASVSSTSTTKRRRIEQPEVVGKDL